MLDQVTSNKVDCPPSQPLEPESRNVPSTHAGGGERGSEGDGIARAAAMETEVGMTHTGHFFPFNFRL